jgi:hypothetical protein
MGQLVPETPSCQDVFLCWIPFLHRRKIEHRKIQSIDQSPQQQSLLPGSQSLSKQGHSWKWLHCLGALGFLLQETPPSNILAARFAVVLHLSEEFWKDLGVCLLERSVRAEEQLWRFLPCDEKVFVQAVEHVDLHVVVGGRVDDGTGELAIDGDDLQRTEQP